MHRNSYRSIDPQVLLQAVGDDIPTFLDLSETFLRIAPPMLAKLERAASSGNCAKALLESHSLKSTASLVGAVRLARSCADIEALARRDDCAALIRSLVAVADELALVMQEVRDSIEEMQEIDVTAGAAPP